MSTGKPAYSRKAVAKRKRLKHKVIREQLDAIGREYLARKQGGKARTAELAHSERPDGFIKREVYWLGKRILKGPMKAWDPLRLIVDVREKRQTRPERQGEIFVALFSSVFSDNTISRDDRSRWTRELNFAFHHKVPAKYVCGFLMQSGPERILRQRLGKEKVAAPKWAPNPDTHGKKPEADFWS